MKTFDANRPALTRDGRPVTIWRRRDGLLMGAIHLGAGCFEGCCWGERSGLRIDTDHPSGGDLVNAPEWLAQDALNRLRDSYDEHDLRARFGVRFDTFLICPDEILASVAGCDPDAAPLLPEQAAVMHAQIEAELVPPGAHLRG
ncbi:hypothetical protein Tgr7_0413 [Thioalkalivibrio sulfidiphilus HL-EbGr7]|uniref:Uncharacterized protein n=1 Tax=Thioalkalivibrio sulfidiphilus (strain HL-EbGR7) TaxID=396588 RepID=B8GV00_THISH|nr:hypothetical protein [Thioalkalivibrio sulfidiphilus]ACL71511.1 hypothetical protein Tgr7_0413 [Thioalkalivibrio sulfidiphilus HL-EbGr7]